MTRFCKLLLVAAGALCALVPCGSAQAAPYASRISISGTQVSFILNEAADALGYRINGGPLQSLDGSGAGVKSFSLSAPTDTFDIIAAKLEATGFTIPTGGSIPATSTGLSQSSPQSGSNLISSDSNLLTRFNAPRGVSVSDDPNAPNFGVAYVANSTAGTVAGRTLGDGLYALNPDLTDAFGYGDVASNPVLADGFPAFLNTSASSPFRLFTADDGEVYVSDWSDANGNLIQVSHDLTSGANVFEGFGGPNTLPPGQNHGSVSASHVEGSLAGGNLTVYTVDEDLTSAHLGGESTTDQNSLWRYDVGASPALSDANDAVNFTAGPFPINVSPVRVNDDLMPIVTTDMERGADGKFYLSQLRSGGNEAGVYVTDPSGATLYDSLTASRQILANPTAVDILRNVAGVAVSRDQQWLAVMLNNSDIVVIPLVDGIPKLEQRLVVDTGADIVAGRDLAFDAAGNLHYVSSGQGIYRVLAPGGTRYATTSFDGATFSFFMSSVPEPSTLAVAVSLALWAPMFSRRRGA